MSALPPHPTSGPSHRLPSPLRTLFSGYLLPSFNKAVLKHPFSERPALAVTFKITSPISTALGFLTLLLTCCP